VSCSTHARFSLCGGAAQVRMSPNASDPTAPHPIPTSQFLREYVLPREISEMTGLSKSKFFRSLQSGELRGHRLGGTWLIHVDDLRHWIEGGRDDG
jgi:excisionase family DNA binding protein